ncbi:MAG: hypothetical protein WHS88_11710 [Anaerohalosphaeraceae bacterium]
MVNLEDLAIAAEYWLTAVFDDRRLCGLCNLHSDPNIPPGRQPPAGIWPLAFFRISRLFRV